METPDASRTRVPGAAAVGPTGALWLRMLVRCLAWSGAVLVVAAAVALGARGVNAAASAFFGYALVALFFGVSLLIGHFVGRTNPSGALGIFIVTYAIKVVGFAAVLFFIGAPQWLDRQWFFGAAVGTVVLWQTVEITVFASARHQLYDDDETDQGAGTRVADEHA